MKKRYLNKRDEKFEYGPNGKLLCRFCRTEVSGRRKTFCSDLCVHEFLIRKDASYARRTVFQRDRGVCRMCGLDCHELEERTPNWCAAVEAAHLINLGFKEKRVKGEDYFFFRKPFWEMNHKVPVVEGGGSCGLDNLETLCKPCHRKETTALAGRRARK